MPVIGLINNGSADASAGMTAAFRKGLNETGHVEGQNATIEYHYLEGQFDRLSALVAERTCRSCNRRSSSSSSSNGASARHRGAAQLARNCRRGHRMMGRCEAITLSAAPRSLGRFAGSEKGRARAKQNARSTLSRVWHHRSW
jgi:hypothetical protein